MSRDAENAPCCLASPCLVVCSTSFHVIFLKQIQLARKQEAGMCLTKEEQSLLLLLLL